MEAAPSSDLSNAGRTVGALRLAPYLEPGGAVSGPWTPVTSVARRLLLSKACAQVDAQSVALGLSLTRLSRARRKKAGAAHCQSAAHEPEVERAAVPFNARVLDQHSFANGGSAPVRATGGGSPLRLVNALFFAHQADRLQSEFTDVILRHRTPPVQVLPLGSSGCPRGE